MRILLISVILFSFTYSLQAEIDAEDHLIEYRKGVEAYEKQSYDKAFTHLKTFVKTKPFQYEIRNAYYFLGMIAKQKTDYLDAISYYNILQTRFPHSKYRKKILFHMGECYFNLLIYDRSERYLVRYLEKDRLPDKNIDLKVRTHILLAQMAQKQRAYERASKMYRKTLLLLGKADLPGSEEIQRDTYYQLGLIYSRKRNDYRRAVDYFNRYLALGGEQTVTLKFAMRKLTILRLKKENGLPENTIADIKVDGDDVYIATWTSGLVRYARSADEFERIRLPSRNLRNIYVDDSKLYLTSFDGILVYDKLSGQSFSLTAGNRIFNLAQKVIKDDRHLYFSTLLKGVVKYDVIKQSIETIGRDSFLKTNEVYALDANHRYLAFGTLSKGAVIVDKKTDEVHYINKENKLLTGNNVKALLIDGRYVWVGVHKKGIFRYDLQTKKSRFYDWKLAYPTVLAKREKEIWVGTSGHGLRIYNQATEKLVTMRAIEGLSSNDINLLQIEGNYVWIGYLDAGIDILYRPYED